MNGGWREKRLGDVLTLEYGKPLPPEARDREGKYAVYGANGVKARSDKFFCDKPSIIVGRKGSAGEITLTEDKFWPLDVTYFVTFDESEYDLQFLYYLLSLQDLTKLAKGVKPGINRNEVYAKGVRVPPLPEQQRIVAILDEAFAGLATATANAEKNLKNARDLFDSYLISIFVQDEEERDEKQLGDLCALFVDSAHRTPKYQPEGIPALRPRDVVNGKLSLSEAARVSEKEYETQSKRHRPAAGDIVYSRELSYGWAALLPETPRVCLSQGMCLFRASSAIETSFLLYMLNGPIGRQQAMKAAVGTAHPHINLGDIKGYRIPVPPLEKQRKIVAELDALSSAAQQLAASYGVKVKMLADLKQSILQKAFSGELTAPPSQAIKEAAE